MVTDVSLILKVIVLKDCFYGLYIWIIILAAIWKGRRIAEIAMKGG
jgi:hypothetical protein